jgi:two-component sensor histidine kinase
MLTVSDNGVGIPDNIKTSQSDSLGMTLIYSLAKQIKGSAVLERTNGTKFTIQFESNAA